MKDHRDCAWKPEAKSSELTNGKVSAPPPVVWYVSPNGARGQGSASPRWRASLPAARRSAESTPRRAAPTETFRFSLTIGSLLMEGALTHTTIATLGCWTESFLRSKASSRNGQSRTTLSGDYAQLLKTLCLVSASPLAGTTSGGQARYHSPSSLVSPVLGQDGSPNFGIF